MTMIYGFLCLLWSPRFTSRSIVYSVVVIGCYGWFVKTTWSLNRDFVAMICKVLSLVFAAKSLHLTYGILKDWLQ